VPWGYSCSGSPPVSVSPTSAPVPSVLRFGWRAAFLFACVPGLLFAWLMYRMPEPVRGALDRAQPAASTSAALQAPYAAVLRLPTMWWIILSGIFHNFNMYAIGAFQTPFCSVFTR